jgi:hypothetical protein
MATTTRALTPGRVYSSRRFNGGPEGRQPLSVQTTGTGRTTGVTNDGMTRGRSPRGTGLVL